MTLLSLCRLAALTFVMALPQNFQARTAENPWGRYYGLQHVGPGAYDYQAVTFTLVKGRNTLGVIWTRTDQSGEKERRDLPLTDVKLDGQTFSATVKGKRPDTIPEKWVGTFVTKFPPNNAKGAVVDGLLLEGGWFVQLTD